MVLVRRMLAAIGSLRRSPPAPRPISRGPVTTLKAVPLPDPEVPPPHPERALVERYWLEHCRKAPGLAWPQFIRRLEDHHRFFVAERQAREAKLADLQQHRKHR